MKNVNHLTGRANDNDIFASLPGSIKEVYEVAKDFKGKKIILKNNEVTKENFLKYAPRADYIYLATHAQSDNYNRFKNRLVFHGENKNEFLTIGEIYSLELIATKIILRNCESSVGTYYKGTSMQSLCKLFLNPNCIVESNSTKINDFSEIKNNIVYY